MWLCFLVVACAHSLAHARTGVMRKYSNASELAADAGLPPSVLQKTFEAYNAAAARGSADPHGRKFFTNAPFRMDEELHVAVITPVVHCALRAVLRLRLRLRC